MRLSGSRKIILIMVTLTLFACNSTTNPTQDEPAQAALVSSPMPTVTPTPLGIELEDDVALPPPTLVWTLELEELKSIVLGEGCQEPCMLGIQPGVTPADQVPEILSQHEGIVEDFFLRPNQTSLRYDVDIATISDFAGVAIGIDEELNIVTYAGIYPDAKFISLEDVINIYGPPQLVSIGWGDSFEGLYLAYEEPDIFLWVRSDSLGDKTLAPDMSLIRFVIQTPYMLNHPINAGVVTWIEWEGFKDFEYYYQKVTDAKEEA